MVLDTTMAAGAQLLQHSPYPYSALPHITNFTEFLARSEELVSGGTPAIANYFAPHLLASGATAAAPAIVTGASGLGPQMLIAAVAVGSYKFGEYYVAPFVAPQLGDLMVEKAPNLFVPSAVTP